MPRAAANYVNRYSRAIIAHYLKGRKERKVITSCFFFTLMRAVVAATRVAKMAISQGCHSRWIFFYIFYTVKVLAC